MEKIENNKLKPQKVGTYGVEYSDGTKGFAYFNGNYWVVEYSHPVRYWYEENTRKSK
jgi:hypothetical protein